MKSSTLRDLNDRGLRLTFVAAAKTGDKTTGRYLQTLLRGWLAEDPARTEAEFARLSELSRGTINNLKNKGEGAGAVTVERFAKAIGKTKAQLYADADRWSRGGQVVDREPGIDGPCYGDLPGWREAEAEARKLYPDVPDVGFRLAGSMHGEAIPARIDARVVGELARWAWTVAGFRERIETETADVQARLDEKRAVKGRKRT